MRLLIATATALALAALAPGARADSYGDRLIAQGNELFKTGNYVRATEVYKAAVLEEPSDGAKKLVFGTSLFALGHYAYAAWNFRRGVEYLGYTDDLQMDLATLFPTHAACDRAVRDVRRYVQYWPNDPHALATLAYAAYFTGDPATSADACRRLLQADGRDAFAAYILRRIERDGAPAPVHIEISIAPAPRPVSQQPPPAPKPPPIAQAPTPPPAPAPKPPAPDARAEALKALGEQQGGARMGPVDTPSKDADAPRAAVAK
jgi:tetratricopeptide (TPR) repeat protein